MRDPARVLLVVIGLAVLGCAGVPPDSPPTIPTATSPAVTASPGLPPTPTPGPSPTGALPPTEGRVPELIVGVAFEDIALAVDVAGHPHILASLPGEPLLYMTDAGAGWSVQEISSPPALGADRDLQVAVSDGTVHAAFVRWTEWRPCLFECPPVPSVPDGVYYLSAPIGGSWGKAQRLPFEVASDGGIDGLDLAVAGDTVHMTFRPWSSDTNVIVYGNNRTGTWQFEDALEGGWAARLALTSAGSPVIAFGYLMNEQYGIGYAEQAAVGGFEEMRIPGSDGGLWPLLGLDAEDWPHVVFSYDDGRSMHTYRDADGWTSPQPLAQLLLTDAAVDERGAVHVLYDAAEGDQPEGLWYATNRSGVLERLHVDRRSRWVADGPLAPSGLALDRAGRAHLLYVVSNAERGNGLRYAVVPVPPDD